MEHLKTISTAIEASLLAIKYRSEPLGLYEPIAYTLELGGKRMRPLLAGAVGQMYNLDIDEMLPLCRAVEVFHNFTLLHDDIMDRAPIRRGKPTVYKKWDENTAILSGDVMLVHAYQYLSALNTEHIKEILDSFNEGAIKVCEGQQYDMNFERQSEVSVDDYLEMIYLKTAALLEHTVDMAALMANVPQEERNQLREFAKYTGISFQLRDDWLDAFGNMEKVGKQKGGDILANKKTYLLLKSLELADDIQRIELEKWLSIQEVSKEKVDAVTEIFMTLGVDRQTDKLIREYYQRGVDALSGLSSEHQVKQELLHYLDSLMQRES